MGGITQPCVDERYTESNLRKVVENWRSRRYERMMNRIVKNGSNRMISVAALGMRHVPQVRESDTRSTKPKLRNNLPAGNPNAAFLTKAKRQPLGGQTTSGEARKLLNGNPFDGHEKFGDDCKQETLQGPLSSTPCPGKPLDLPSFSISAIKKRKPPIDIQSKKCLEFENA